MSHSCPTCGVSFRLERATEPWLEELRYPIAEWLKRCVIAKAKGRVMPGACPSIEAELTWRGAKV